VLRWPAEATVDRGHLKIFELNFRFGSVIDILNYSKSILLLTYIKTPDRHSPVPHMGNHRTSLQLQGP
jgi:hypothetical protein